MSSGYGHILQHPWARVWGLLSSQLEKTMEVDLAEFSFGGFRLYLISPAHGKGPV